MTSVPNTSSLLRAYVCVLAVAIAGCGHLGYGASDRDAGSGEIAQRVDGGGTASLVDAAMEDRDGDVVPTSDAGGIVGLADAGDEPSDAGALDSGPTPIDAGPTPIDSGGSVPGCPLGCTRDEYCATPLGMCSAAGACSPRPTSCLDVYDPVRGCDGNDYSNGCVAAQAGVSIASRGADI